MEKIDARKPVMAVWNACAKCGFEGMGMTASIYEDAQEAA